LVERVETDLDLRAELSAAHERIASLERELKPKEGLSESEATFRVLVEHSPDVIMTLDRKGHILFINHTLPSLTNEEVVGTHVLQYVDERHRDSYQEALTEVFEVGDPRSLELSAAGPSWWLTRLIPIKRDDVVETALVIATDITERKRSEMERLSLEAQMQHSQKLESLGVLAGGIAHDFNNILTGILGSASIAAMKVPPGSPAGEQLARILKAADKAAELTNQMLAYAGKGRFEMEPLGLNELVQEVIPLVETSIAKKTRLTQSFAEDLPPIKADQTQLQQVVMNLITNASEALGGEEGQVSLRTGACEAPRGGSGKGSRATTQPRVFLEVTDSGVGMDVATREKIFDPFYTTKFTGRGLGLAAVQGIVRAHNGTIEVESFPGRGTTFTVVFPASDRRRAQRLEPVKKAAVRASGTILIIDDEESVRNVAQASLEQAGFHVLLARDGAEALDVFNQHASEVDAVLLDMSMPRMSGEETLAGLREVHEGVRVVLTSGYSEHEISAKFEGKGLSGFVQKPFRASELVEKMHAAIVQPPEHEQLSESRRTGSG